MVGESKRSTVSGPTDEIEKSLRNEGFFFVGGLDEAGRGCLAGPVVAACVMLDPDQPIEGLNDSKKVSPRQRDRLFDLIMARARSVGVGVVDPATIDEINILKASHLAMAQAVAMMSLKPDYALIDGHLTIDISIPQKAIIKGDGRCTCIAAGSIIAKVTRDRLMAELQATYQHFQFSIHKGYPTAKHRDEIRQHGPTPIHRFTFAGVVTK